MNSLKIVFIISMLMISTGCWDRLELEEQAYVVVIGFDKSENDELIDITFQIANPQVGSAVKVQTKEPPSEIITISAPDFVSARDTANASVTRKLRFSHSLTIIIGEELAKLEKLKHILAATIRDYEIRREINIIVTKENASEFIRANKPELETRPHKYYEFMQKRWEDTGLVPYSTYNRYAERTEGMDSLFLAIYATAKKINNNKKDAYEDNYYPGEINIKKNNKIQMIGSAVFKNGKMIGTLTGEETRGTLLLRREAKAESWLATYEDPLKPKYRVTARLLKKEETDINVKIEGQKAKIDVQVPLNIQVLSIPSLVNYVSDINKQSILKKSIEEQLEKKAKALVKKSLKDFKGEPFTWYREIRKQFWTIDEYNKFNWMESCVNADVNIDFDVTIIGFGKQFKPATIKEREE